jgi:glycosyltransferase involved in cell wall biosynthesis
LPESLTIALVSPHAWPARDDLARHVEAQAEALARRGHRVTVLAPGVGRARLTEGRARLRALARGDRDALAATPGAPLAVAVGRALPGAAGRRLAGPFDLSANLEAALGSSPFDVVHLHEPLAPSPALPTLRHAPGVTAATFHRTEQLAGVAFLRPLVDRALARVDLRMAASEVARRALLELLPGDYLLVMGGVDDGRFAPPEREPEGPPGLVIIARGRERAGVRFALRALRAVDLDAVGPVTVLGPAEAPWRTRAAIPKALRAAVTAVADEDADARAAAFAKGRIALVATPEDAASPVLAEAMASGLAVLAPRGEELEGVMTHGVEGLALPPFSLEAWAEAVAELARDDRRRGELGARAAARAGGRPWDRVAEELEGHYLGALGGRRAHRPRVPLPERILADLRVRPAPDADPDALVAACIARGLGAVAVAAPGGLEPAFRVAAAAPPELTVVVGQEIATDDGVLVGLFLRRAVEDGLPIAEALARIREQGGVVMVPHPATGPVPSPEALRRHAQDIDCYQVLAGPPGAAVGGDEAGLVQRLGLLVTAGSGAERPEDVGAPLARMRPFDGPDGFLEALAGAELTRRRRGLRTRPGRQRRGPRRTS